MAIDIIYVDEGRGVIMRICDEVNGEEVIDAHNKIFQKSNLMNQQYFIIDKSWCTEYNVTADDIHSISQIYRKIAHINSNLILAIVESSILKYSLTDACLAHIVDYIQDSKSFSNQNEALVWIRDKLHEKDVTSKALE